MGKSNILIYQTEDGATKIETRLENETVWLTQAQMSELFQKERSVITKHINNVFKEGELEEKSNVQTKNELSEAEKHFIKQIEATVRKFKK